MDIDTKVKPKKKIPIIVELINNCDQKGSDDLSNIRHNNRKFEIKRPNKESKENLSIISNPNFTIYPRSKNTVRPLNSK